MQNLLGERNIIEEILFAPGMFKADQKNFFTYVFLFALEPKPALTAEVLRKELLTKYGFTPAGGAR